VSACAADLFSAFPHATLEQVREALRASPALLVDARNGRTYPRLDCRASLDFLAAVLAPLDGGASDAAALDASQDAALDAEPGPGADAALDAALDAVIDASDSTDAASEDRRDADSAEPDGESAGASGHAGGTKSPPTAGTESIEPDAQTMDGDASTDASMPRDGSAPMHDESPAQRRRARPSNCGCVSVGMSAAPATPMHPALGLLVLAAALFVLRQRRHR
jgi:MYXO-CTERM domain-containing protein